MVRWYIEESYVFLVDDVDLYSTLCVGNDLHVRKISSTTLGPRRGTMSSIQDSHNAGNYVTNVADLVFSRTTPCRPQPEIDSFDENRPSTAGSVLTTQVKQVRDRNRSDSEPEFSERNRSVDRLESQIGEIFQPGEIDGYATRVDYYTGKQTMYYEGVDLLNDLELGKPR